MKWPWQKNERRDSGGDFSDAVVRLLEAQAAGSAADASSTAAVEAAAGALSRAFASATVEGESWVQDAVTPTFLAQVGRDLIRAGDSMHVIRVGSNGMAQLIPCSSWHWEGNHDPDSWTVRATAYGPSTSTTWNVSSESVVFVKWGSSPGQPYIGTGPTSWAHLTARLQSEAERSLADEAGGPLAQLISIPSDGGDGEDTDPMKLLKADIAKSRGKAVLLETTQAGWDTGRAAAPQRDWKPARLGPEPTEAMVAIAKDSFARMLAACGASPSLFDDSDGTSKREALRQFHLGAVRPLAKILETELSAKLETPVRLQFDLYAIDLQGRATAFAKMVQAGMAIEKAASLSGVLMDDADAA